MGCQSGYAIARNFLSFPEHSAAPLVSRSISMLPGDIVGGVLLLMVIVLLSESGMYSHDYL